MKNLKLSVAFILLTICTGVSAQQPAADEQKGKFKQENIFLGTSLNLGIANRSFNVGLNPEIGYSVTRWLDAGVSLNINYFSQNASDFSPNRFRDFSYGGGTFLRVWPLSFLHFQILPEYNWTNRSIKNMQTGYSESIKPNGGSLLLGVGYGGRLIGAQYSYVTLMIDVLQNDSPYRDQYKDPLPVFRAGFGMYLKPRRR